MRRVLLAACVAGIGLLAAVLLRGDAPLPAIGPDVEAICLDAMKRTAADLSWVAPGREQTIRGRTLTTATLGELPALDGRLVRVAGVLHLEFEGEALYSSRKAMEDDPFSGTWLSFRSLWPGEYAWRTRGPSVSDRCAVVEGPYSAGGRGHLGAFRGAIEVVRLDVWSTPHRPYIPAPTPPPPPAR
jgi:hypothetical protein